MVANLGYGALVIAFLVCLFGIGAAYYGSRRNDHAWVESGRNAMLLTWPLLTVSALSIIYLLVTNHYEVDYVASVTSNSMPVYLKVTALWGGQAGSLVFWSWLMAAFASAVTLRKWDRDREFLPWVVIVALTTLAFFLALIILFENPFLRLWQTATEIKTAMWQPAGSVPFAPSDGNGLNPLLRHPGMIIHPPMLYLGFVSFVIPYAFAIAALVTGRSDDRWIRITRRWTLVAWLFLSGLGWVLGLGPGGDCRLYALADRHSIPSLRDDPGKTGDAEALEHGADHPDLRPGHLWNVPHPVWRTLLRACLRPKRHRAGLLRVYRPDFHYLSIFASPPVAGAQIRGAYDFPPFEGSPLSVKQPAVSQHLRRVFLGCSFPPHL
jgi:hypothetical protein